MEYRDVPHRSCPASPSRPFTAIAAVSASTRAALMVLWIHSVRANDVLLLPRHRGDHWLVTSAFGTVTFQWEGAQSGAIKPDWVFMQRVAAQLAERLALALFPRLSQPRIAVPVPASGAGLWAIDSPLVSHRVVRNPPGDLVAAFQRGAG